MTGLAIAPEGVVFFAVLATLAFVAFLLATWLDRWPVWLAGYALAILAVFAAFFFRDPVRVGERGPDLYLSPADGRVVGVERVDDADYLPNGAVRVAIYLGLLDVHVQRSPADGVVDYVRHRPGTFAPAWSDRAGANESASIGISTGRVRVLVRQVAGTVARRIVTYPDEGELVDQGERIGLIRFGSRVETYLPPDAAIAVRVGDRVLAGITVIATAPEGRP